MKEHILNEYTIKDIVCKTGLSAYTLRYYDKIGLMPTLKRNDKKVRIYTNEDICRLELICCLKDSGMSLKDIARFMDMCLIGKETNDEKIELLKQHKESIIKQIDSLNCSLQIVNHKINHIDDLNFK